MAGVVTDKVIVELEARLGRYHAEVNAARANFERTTAGMASSAEMAERRIARSSGAIKSALLGTASTLAAAFSVQAVTRLADGYTRFTNQLKLAGLEGGNLVEVQDALFSSAQRYGVELEGLGQLYGRVAQAGRELGASQEDLLRFTNGVAAAIKIQGASADSVKGALLQLSQALGGTNVRAEEYDSINEGARPILQAVANGSDRFRGSVNALRNAVIEGKVSAQEFYAAFLKGSAGLEEQATKANLTIGASLTILNNALGRYIGQTDQSLSATQRISGGIQLLAENIDTVANAFLILIGLVGARYVGSLLSATGATIAKAGADALAAQNARAHAAAVAAQTAANARLTASGGAATAALRFQAAASLSAAGGARAMGASLVSLAGGSVGIAVLAVAALAAGIIYLNNKYSEGAVVGRELAASTTATGSALDEYEKAAIKAATATANNAQEARANAAAMRQEALDAIRSARALRERTAAMAASRAAAAADALAEVQNQGPREEGAAIGQLAYAAGAEAEARRAADQAEQARKDLAAAEARLKEITDNLANGGYHPIPVAPAAETRGKSAEEIEDERQRIERRFNDDLRDANRSVLDARDRQARTVAEQLASEVRLIEQRRDDLIAEANERGPAGSGEYTQARVDQLTAIYRLTASIEAETVAQDAAAELARQALQTEQARAQNVRDLLTASREIADSDAERAALSQRLLDLSFEQEEAQLRAIIAAQDSTEAEIAIARARLEFLPQLQAAQREALRRENLTPLERLSEEGRRGGTATGRREGGEEAVANGLDSLAGSLAKATVNMDGFGEAILSTVQGILEEVLTAAYQDVIVAPIADLARQGLDALFGTAATTLKTTADTNSAIASNTAAVSMGRTAIAAAVLSKALLSAAAAASASKGADAAKAIASSFGGGKAIGGRVSPNLSYMVGENGPERFTPDGPGTITPNLKFATVPPRVETRGGTTVAFTYAPTIDARGADQAAVDRLERAQAQDRKTLDSRVKQIVNRGLANDSIGQPIYK